MVEQTVELPTRTTRMPEFWGYPPPPHDYPYYWVILDPMSNEGKVKLTNLKNLPKFQLFHATHLLKLLDKICKYKMDPMSIVEDTERTRFCPQTDGRTDRQGETSIAPFQPRWSGGYNKLRCHDMWRHCNEIAGILLILLKFIPKGPINRDKMASISQMTF